MNKQRLIRAALPIPFSFAAIALSFSDRLIIASWICIGIWAILIAYSWWQDRQESNRTSREMEERTKQFLESLDPRQIAQFEYAMSIGITPERAAEGLRALANGCNKTILPNSICKGCKYFFGFGGHGIVCAVHPHGLNSEFCVDREEGDIAHE